MLAVALGSTLAQVRARLDAEFGPAPVVAAPAGGFKSVKFPDGTIVESTIAANGTEMITNDTRKAGDPKKGQVV